MTEAQASSPTSQPTAAHHPIWFVVLGVVFILCGFFALMAPIVSTLAATLTVGIAVGVGGVAQVLQAFRSPAWKGFFLHLLLGLVYIAGSAAFIFRPVMGAFVIAMTLSWILFIAGAGEIALGLRVRPQKGWVWLVVSGLIALIGGVWLLMRLPIAGFFVPGTILGIALLFEGWAFIALGLGRDRPAARDEAPVGTSQGDPVAHG